MITTLHAAAMIVVVEAVIRVVPLQRLGHLLGVPVDLAARAPNDPLPWGQLPARAQQQLRCSKRVADAWPFSKGPCLRRALVGGHLVRRLDPAIRLGVTGAGDGLLAHAWLEVDGRPLESVGGYLRFEQRAGTRAR